MRINHGTFTRLAVLLALPMLWMACDKKEAAREKATPANANVASLNANTREPDAKSGQSDAAGQPSASVNANQSEGPSGESGSEEFEGTSGIIEKGRERMAPVILKNVRTASHAGFDRVVFEFESAVPGYHVEYIDRPVRQCGSGDAVPVAGDAWLEVRFSPANAHTEAGKPTIPFREQRLSLPNLKELERTCDFEADVTWVLGLASPKRYRVLELSSPPRLVIDVKH